MAVGVGVFIANILAIERLSELQVSEVKLSSDPNDNVRLTEMCASPKCAPHRNVRLTEMRASPMSRSQTG